MATFQIQNSDGTLSQVGHDKFFEILNGEDGFLYYKRGGRHIAMLPTAENAEVIRACRQAEKSGASVVELENRCRDRNGYPCRYQHDANGKIIRNDKGRPVHAKCTACPRNGWTDGNKENCCIQNYCKVEDCTYCPYPRECHSPHSLEWLTEDKTDYGEHENGGFSIAGLSVDPQEELETEELTSSLLGALKELPEKERAVLKAIYWDKLSRRACASELEIPTTTVNRLHEKALASLKNILKDFR